VLDVGTGPGDVGHNPGVNPAERPAGHAVVPRRPANHPEHRLARIVVRHLRERVTIAPLASPPRAVPEIWLRQVTDAAGFQVITVAALRSVGVPARLDANGRAEFYDGSKWQVAPEPGA